MHTLYSEQHINFVITCRALVHAACFVTVLAPRVREPLKMARTMRMRTYRKIMADRIIQAVLDLCNGAVSEKTPQIYLDLRCPLSIWQKYYNEQTLQK